MCLPVAREVRSRGAALRGDPRSRDRPDVERGRRRLRTGSHASSGCFVQLFDCQVSPLITSSERAHSWLPRWNLPRGNCRRSHVGRPRPRPRPRPRLRRASRRSAARSSAHDAAPPRRRAASERGLPPFHQPVQRHHRRSKGRAVVHRLLRSAIQLSGRRSRSPALRRPTWD